MVTNWDALLSRDEAKKISRARAVLCPVGGTTLGLWEVLDKSFTASMNGGRTSVFQLDVRTGKQQRQLRARTLY